MVRKTFKITTLNSSMEAIVMILSGVIYFLRKHTFKTILVILIFLAGPVYITYEFFTIEKARIIEALPLGNNYSLIPELKAEQLGDSILIKRKFYGWNDTNVKVWKVKNEPVVIIYNIREDVAFKIELDVLRQLRMKEMKK